MAGKAEFSQTRETLPREELLEARSPTCAGGRAGLCRGEVKTKSSQPEACRLESGRELPLRLQEREREAFCICAMSSDYPCISPFLNRAILHA